MCSSSTVLSIHETSVYTVKSLHAVHGFDNASKFYVMYPGENPFQDPLRIL